MEIHRAELVDEGEGRATFEIECSSGTYIRTLIETLGDAYCEELRRTAVGPLRLADASDEPISANDALVFLPERELDAAEATSIANGRPIDAAGDPEGPLRLTHEGRLLAVAHRADPVIRPEVVLEPAAT